MVLPPRAGTEARAVTEARGGPQGLAGRAPSAARVDSRVEAQLDPRVVAGQEGRPAEGVAVLPPEEQAAEVVAAVAWL
jgi:hypothetical protein